MHHDPYYLAFSANEYDNRYKDIRERMDRVGLSALLVYGKGSGPEIHYLCNWLTTTEAHLIFPANGEPALFVQLSNHVPNAKRMAVIKDVRFGGTNSHGLPDSIPSVTNNLIDRGITQVRVGIAGALPYQQFIRLQEQLPSIEWVDFDSEMRDQRVVKSPEEIERIRVAALLSDRSVSALAEQVQPGITEYQLARIVEHAYLDEGGVNGIHFMLTTSMSDPKGGVPQQYMTNRKISKGDILVTEISASYWGYTGQILRSFTIGAEATPQYQDMHAVAVEAFERTAAVIKDGTAIEEVLAVGEVVHKRGYTIYDDFLHGANQLPPILRTTRTSRGTPTGFRFRKNMCIVIQPNIVTLDATMGVQFGEMLRVTETGLERLHEYPRRLIACR